MKTFNLEQEPLQPTPLESQLVQLRKLAGPVNLGIQCELRSFNQVYIPQDESKRSARVDLTLVFRPKRDVRTEDDGIFEPDQRPPDGIQAEEFVH